MLNSVSPVGIKVLAVGCSSMPFRPLFLWRHAPLAVAVVLAGGYAYLLAWFNRVDFYHTGFFVHGPAVTHYQVARLIFIPYFAWTIYWVGAFANLFLFGRGATATFSAWERFPLFFVTGAGLWHLAMYGIGLAGFDIKPVALALSLGTMSLSVPYLADSLREGARAISRARVKLSANSLLTLSLWLGIFVVCESFLLVKGLYPGGGHDYYNHYFQFYKRVVEAGSILPNDVWYHFFYSGGDGLYFLVMLLIDPLAPQLVTTGFIGCGACIVYALLRNAIRSTIVPLVGVLLYVGMFVYTVERVDNSDIQWGILEKTHELTAVLLLAVIWIAYRYFGDGMAKPGPWMLALHSAVICIAVLTLPLTVLIGIYLTGYFVWFACTRQWCMAVRPFAAGVTATVSMLCLSAVNYHYTGFPSGELLLQFWPHADLDKVMQWGILLELLTQLRDSAGRLAGTDAVSWETAPLIAKFLRLELWWPLFLAATPFLAWRLRNHTSRASLLALIDAPAWSALIWFGAATIIVALIGGGLNQPVSFYRMSTFAYAPTLCVGLMICNLALTPAADQKTSLRSRIVILVGMLATAYGAIHILIPGTVVVVRQNLKILVANANALWDGQFSLKDAYQNQQGLPGLPWGAIYPGMIEPWRIAGPRTRIWSFHTQSYCMLPDCNVQEFLSERFSRSWQTVFFGEPGKAIEALKTEGLNYFFFSAELGRSDPIIYTPLFSSATIANYLAIRWTDGTSYLLTWPGPNTRPIDRKFIATYANANNDRIWDQAVLKKISNYIDRHPGKLTPFALPWCTNCIGLESLDGPAQR
jgi:hypothetical protein